MIKIPNHEGYMAARRGQPDSVNPYNVETDIDAHCDWDEGYDEAVDDMEREANPPWYYIKPLYVFYVVATIMIATTLWVSL